VEAVPRVAGLLQHRGPDDIGYLSYSSAGPECGRQWRPLAAPPDVVLLHRRLSILDLSESGWQPMSSHDRRFWMVFNGEIYNFVELREELRAMGYSFRSSSDSEVLLAAYQHWGPECLKRLVGMFALAILDTHTRSLFLARDFFGIKPLYYSVRDGSFAFASEIKALLEFGDNGRKVNPGNVLLYLRHGLSDQGSGTLLSGTKQLPSAHYLEIALDNPTVAEPVRYWEPKLEPTELTFEAAAEKLRELFLESVRLHLRSDVPIGAALSGGIDSSAIVACMRYVAPSLELHTFSYIADDASVSEERWVDLLTEKVRAHAHKARAKADDLVRDLEALLNTQDEPFSGTSVYAQHQVFRLAKEAGVTVMLDGQGADEMLGGYSYYLGARFASLIRQRRFHDAVQFLRSIKTLPDRSPLHVMLWSAEYLLRTEWQKPLRALTRKETTPRWVKSSWFRKHDAEVVKACYCPGPDVLRSVLWQTMTETSLPQLLRYEDRNSMAYSIESRVPFLTPQIAEFLLSLPEHYIIAADGTSKAIFRQAMRGIVPDAILDRRDKIGFATPEREWMRTMDNWVVQTLRSEAAAAIPFLDLQAMQREWEAISQGKQSFDHRVWRWINLIHWSEKLQLEYAE
jgi:asparagine synthase (glutamine-hydrolysing)